MKTALECLEVATNLVGGDRASQHGDKLQNFNNIAAVWNGVLTASGKLSAPLDAADVGNLMEAMKIARRYAGGHNPDDYVDAAGYAGCTLEVVEKMRGPATAPAVIDSSLEGAP